MHFISIKYIKHFIFRFFKIEKKLNYSGLTEYIFSFITERRNIFRNNIRKFEACLKFSKYVLDLNNTLNTIIKTF